MGVSQSSGSKVIPSSTIPTVEDDGVGYEIDLDVNANNNSELRPTNPAMSFPKDGIKLSALRQLITNDKDGLLGLSTTEVCMNIVSVQTLERRCSYNELQKYLSNGHLIGKPAMFVSHAWRYEFVRVVEALEAHIAEGDEDPDPFVWFDLC